MATNPYVYVGNVRRWDGTVLFKFRSTEDNTVYNVPLGAQIQLNSADLDRLNDRYILVPAGSEPLAFPNLRDMNYLDEFEIGVGEVLTKTDRGYEFQPPGGVSGTWKAPVLDEDALPASGNTTGDIRLALNEGMLFYWDSAAWQELAGGGGGGPGPTEPAQNLFIQVSRPADPDINSLWIPVVSGVPGAPEDWEVFTGTSDTGADGDLVIGPDEPDPTMDTLWIPTVSDVPAQLFEWQVFSGHSSPASAGNDNLIFSVSQPSSPPAGSLWVALNVDGTPKSIDNWRVNV